MRRLIVFAGALLERSENGVWLTKQAFLEYLIELNKHYDEIVFIARVADGKVGYLGNLTKVGINVVAVPKGRASVVMLFPKLLKLARDSHLLVFMPNGVALTPILALLRMRVKVFGLYYGNDYREWLGELRLSRLPGGNALYTYSNRRTMRTADFILARGRSIASACLENNENVIETVPIGYMLPEIQGDENTHEEVAKKRGAKLRMLFMGTLTSRKGLPVLFDAIHRVRKIYGYSITLDVLGDGVDRDELERQASELLGSNVVSFHGWLEGADIHNFWRRAELLVVPSLYAEGVPRVIDEAIMRRIPVISRAVGGITEEFSDGEVCLVESGDSEVLAKAIYDICSNDGVRKELLGNAESRRQRWLNAGSAGIQHAACFSQL